ncbi:hypothetical protein [Candidatus Poriferisocius sp.]|uniref:hypothetical protein n=1 Tax=Candidatus Poriferisocius sp. TaxID=3101276 RepID=UPI003B01E652
MTFSLYSDEELTSFRLIPKWVTNPGARWVEKPGHRQRTYKVAGDGGSNFEVFQRESLKDSKDFSCGIAYLPVADGTRITLARYNGPSHRHGDIKYQSHIHKATAKAIAAGKKPEFEAIETDRFTTLEGAFRCLIEDFELRGIDPPVGEKMRLF